MHMAGSNLLITGGAGFLGYYLVRSAVAWNEQVSNGERIRITVQDNYRRGYPSWLQEMTNSAYVAMLKWDASQPLPSQTPDYEYILHAASIASPTYYRKYPLETMDANVNGLRNQLDHALRQRERGQPARAFLYFSSSEVYGDPDPNHIPTSETYRGNVSFTGPRACYDESKRYGETLCVTHARMHELPIKVVRPFNNYGPGQRLDDARVLPDFVRNVLNGDDIVVFSDGRSTRTFCYVADAVIGYYKALIRGRPGEAYNIGVEGPEISIGELASRLASVSRDLLDYQGRPVHGSNEDQNYLLDSPSRRCPSIAKAREELGYNPVVELDEGLRRSLLWYCDAEESLAT